MFSFKYDISGALRSNLGYFKENVNKFEFIQLSLDINFIRGTRFTITLTVFESYYVLKQYFEELLNLFINFTYRTIGNNITIPRIFLYRCSNLRRKLHFNIPNIFLYKQASLLLEGKS